jgi:hypothetical protein
MKVRRTNSRQVTAVTKIRKQKQEPVELKEVKGMTKNFIIFLLGIIVFLSILFGIVSLLYN